MSSQIFRAKFNGFCAVYNCMKIIEKGEYVHYVEGGILAHENCWPGEPSQYIKPHFDGSNLEDERYFHREQNGQFIGDSCVVTGRRKLPFCNKCFLYHNGDCL